MERRSVIFGLGIGIVIVAFVFFVALRFVSPESEVIIHYAYVSDDEIMDRARVLGMVSIRELPETSGTPQTANSDREADLETLVTLLERRNLELVSMMEDIRGGDSYDIYVYDVDYNVNVSAPQVTYANGANQIVIPMGLNAVEIAVLFFTNGIVDSAIDFNNFIIANGMSTRLMEGTFYIPEGSSFADILRIISVWTE